MNLFKSTFAALPLIAGLLAAAPAAALDKPDVTYQVFQFPKDKIPRIDGDTSDWDMVPVSYVVGSDRLIEFNRKLTAPNPAGLKSTVKVGWVKGLNRLYILYEAYDDYWEFTKPGIEQDIFELVVDGDASGGPLVSPGERGKSIFTPAEVGVRRALPELRIPDAEMKWSFQGTHAQNYHILTPAVEKDWTMAWNSATWTKDFPYANSAQVHKLEQGKSGKYILEFYITPYDYAGAEGPERAVESVLYENKIIGLGWAIIDREPSPHQGGFWTLGSQRRMYGDTTDLPAFRLMPIEPALLPKGVDAQWSFKIADMQRRVVAFKDLSTGSPTKWLWTFGDGETSTEQNPVHTYAKAGEYIITLEIEGQGGKSRLQKVWDVQLKF